MPLVVLAAAALAFALAGASDGEDGKRSYRIVFDNAFGLVSGGDFRVGGVRAGRDLGLRREDLAHAARPRPW